MRTTLIAFTTAILAGSLATGAVWAADPAVKEKSSQQNRMKTCNADAKAKSLKGEERKAFMSQCLKSK